MKGRESGMPELSYWETFFEPEGVLRKLVPESLDGPVLEFGCGYGTFVLPLARRLAVRVIGLDIEEDLILRLQATAAQEGLENLSLVRRDFMCDGTGEPDNSVSHVLLYNILHIENPHALLNESQRILKPGGTVSIIHWRSDIPTPRGPSREIRPSAEQCITWANEAGFTGAVVVDLADAAPCHFGLKLTKAPGAIPE